MWIEQRMFSSEKILNLQMSLENGKISFPYGNDESRRVSAILIEELSMFAITERGKFEGIGAHDDMVMSLALANAATYTSNDNFILLDDLGLFNDVPSGSVEPKRAAIGLNF